MSLQERTLVIKNFDPEKTTHDLIKELCIQGGPVKNVVVRPDHAFVEFEHKESVGYAKALFDGVVLFGRKLVMEPKLKNDPYYFEYSQRLLAYVDYDRRCRAESEQQLLMQQQQVNPFSNYQVPLVPQLPILIPPTNIQHNNNNSFGPSTSSRNNPPSWGRDDNLKRSHSFGHNRNKRGKWNDRRR